MSVLKSSAQAVSYYERDDYYAAAGGDPDAQGQWIGRGAERLGLIGADGGNKVDREAFKRMLEGTLTIDGKTVQLGRIVDGKNSHTPGWDLTFSAPKSLSILAEVGGDERLLEAHTEAVKDAVHWLEHNVATYRQLGFFGVRDYRSGNIIAAMFQHDTSRNQDPQTHTHVVVMNATLRQDGRWASLHSRTLFEHKMVAGNIYRAALALRVQQLGYEIEKTGHDGRFELSAVPEELRDVFATRREQIEASLAERGLTDPRSAALAALMTRGTKKVLPRDQLTSEWTARVASAGFNLDPIIERARDAGKITPPEPYRATKSVQIAIDRLSEPEAVFTKAELLRWSLAAAIGRGSVQDIEAAIAQKKTAGRLQEAALKGKPAWTTPKAKEQERRVLEAARAGRGAVKSHYRDSELDAGLAASGLNGGQREAVKLIATSPDRFVGVLGRPGTGKTFMLGVARALLEARGAVIKGMAQTSEAARKLEADSGIKSGTIHRHLRLIGPDLSRLRAAGKNEAASIRTAYEKQIWIVDEASQIDSGMMRRLTFSAERLGARVVLIGDTKQLASIGAGKPFDLLLKDGLQHVEMDDIRRQSDPEHVRAIRHVIAGDITSAVSTLHQNIREVPAFEDRVSMIVKTYKTLGDARHETLVLTAGNQQKMILNEALREVLREEGKLFGERSQEQLVRVFGRRADRMEAGFYQVGDYVRFPRAVARLGIDKGDYWRVIAADKKLNMVTLEKDGGGKPISWNPQRIGANSTRAVEVYRPRPTTLAPGERIRWTRNSKDIDPNKPGAHLANGQLLTVVASGPDRIEVQTDSKARVSIDVTKIAGRHWEHAYASTVYSSQGGTARHVLVNAESDKAELFNQKAFLVAISRQKESLTIFADNIKGFAASVEKHVGDKTSGLDGKAEAQEIRGDGLVQAALEALATMFDRKERAYPTPSPPDHLGRDFGR